VRQDNLPVTVEHAAVSVGLLLEHGGRFPTLNRDLTAEVSRAGNQLLEDLGAQDEASVWAYADSVSQLADFTSNRQTLQQMLLSLKPPDVSEANLYDAVIWAIKRMRPVATRKATVLISSGVDTFSKATFKDAVKVAGQSDAPVYAISLAKVMQADAELRGMTTVKIDWNGCEKNVGEIARASGGRLYSPSDTITLAPTYDDLIQNLKVRYVIAYRSSNHNSPNVPRTVRVELVEPVSGKSLPIKDANGRLVRATVISQERYTPTQASGTSSR
jgi:VWFA-related protein